MLFTQVLCRLETCHSEVRGKRKSVYRKILSTWEPRRRIWPELSKWCLSCGHLGDPRQRGGLAGTSHYPLP